MVIQYYFKAVNGKLMVFFKFLRNVQKREKRKFKLNSQNSVEHYANVNKTACEAKKNQNR